MEQDKSQPVLFNLGIAQVNMISTQIEKAMNNYLGGQIPQWFYNLKGIKFLIVSQLDINEREKLKEKEKVITQSIATRDKCAPLVEEYDILIKEYLEKKGFLVPLKDDMTKLYGQT